MFLTIWCLATLLLTALLLGTSLAPVLGMRTSADYAGKQWLQAHTLTRASAGVGAVLEPLTILAAVILAVLLRDWRPALLAALAGSACLAVSYLLVGILVSNRVNTQIVQWKPDALPSDWQIWRRKWQISHAARFALHLAGFILLTLATLISPLTQE